VLEFAAGFGRFTRHLAARDPGPRDGLRHPPRSVDFLREQMGVDGFYSTHVSRDARDPRQYDLVFVLSMFTHLPPAMWAPWLRKLHAAVRPGGNLVFTCTTSASRSTSARSTAPTGPSSSATASRVSSRRAVRDDVRQARLGGAEVERALGVKVSHFREAAFWHGQRRGRAGPAARWWTLD
jgi:hypothetical protein